MSVPGERLLALARRPPPRIRLARLPTPFEPLDRLHARIGGPRIWVKRDDLTESGAGGNKIRKLEFSLAQALAEGCDTLLSCGGLQSNHCRATALLGAKLGFAVELVLRGEPSGDADGNHFIDLLAGARVHTYPAARYRRSLPEILDAHAAQIRAADGRPFLIPTGASDATGVWGYLLAAAELAEDFARAGIAPAHLLCATGSGGTQAGLTAGLHVLAPDCRVHGVAVCDDAAWFAAKVRADLEAWRARYDVDMPLEDLRISTLEAYIGPGYGEAGPEVMQTIAELARLEGLLLDPVYSGKAFHGLLQELAAGRLGDSGNVVFLHTGGTFGLFPQRRGILAALG